MPYIGKSPSFGVRNRFVYVASSGATSVSGADANGATLTFTDGAFVDVYLNGVLLKPTTDYNTSTANTIAGLSALNTNDEVTVVVYDVFSVSDTVSATSGGTFVGNVNFSGNIDVDGTANLDVVDIDGAVDMASSLTVGGAFTSVGIDDNADATTMTIDTSENVGIGNTSPSSQYMTRLVVGDGSGTEGITIYSGNDSQGRLEFSDATSGDGRYAGGIVYNHSTNKLRFNTNGGNERMSIDSNGYVLKPTNPMWWVQGNQNNNVANSSNDAYETFVFPAETYDIGGGYNTSNGRYVAPVAGKYFVYGTLLIQGLNSSTEYYQDIAIFVNGSQKLRHAREFNSYARAQTIFVSGLVHCDASDYIEVKLRLENVSNQVVYSATTTSIFQGFLIG